jgi:hypothetical protein
MANPEPKRDDLHVVWCAVTPQGLRALEASRPATEQERDASDESLMQMFLALVESKRLPQGLSYWLKQTKQERKPGDWPTDADWTEFESRIEEAE